MASKSNTLQSLVQKALVNGTQSDISRDWMSLLRAFPDQACLFRCICHLGGIDSEEDQMAVALIACRLGLLPHDFYVEHQPICDLVSVLTGKTIIYKGKSLPVSIAPRARLVIVDHWVWKKADGHFVCGDYDPKPGTNAVTYGSIMDHRIYEVRDA